MTVTSRSPTFTLAPRRTDHPPGSCLDLLACAAPRKSLCWASEYRRPRLFISGWHIKLCRVVRWRRKLRILLLVLPPALRVLTAIPKPFCMPPSIKACESRWTQRSPASPSALQLPISLRVLRRSWSAGKPHSKAPECFEKSANRMPSVASNRSGGGLECSVPFWQITPKAGKISKSQRSIHRASCSLMSVASPEGTSHSFQIPVRNGWLETNVQRFSQFSEANLEKHIDAPSCQSACRHPLVRLHCHGPGETCSEAHSHCWNRRCEHSHP